jgi:hypothetical protein
MFILNIDCWISKIYILVLNKILHLRAVPGLEFDISISKAHSLYTCIDYSNTRYGACQCGSKRNTINLILRLRCHTFLHTKNLTEESQVARLHKKHKQPCKHHHLGGRAARPSSGVDLMNPHHRRGGWPCIYLFQGRH